MLYVFQKHLKMFIIKIHWISLCEHMMDITICSVEHLRGTVGPCFDSKIFREIIPPHAELLARARMLDGCWDALGLVKCSP